MKRRFRRAQKRFDTKIGTTEAKKAAEEFKDIESKRKGVRAVMEGPHEISALLEMAKAGDWEGRHDISALLEMVKAADREAGHARVQRFVVRPASDAELMSVFEWAEAIEGITGFFHPRNLTFSLMRLRADLSQSYLKAQRRSKISLVPFPSTFTRRNKLPSSSLPPSPWPVEAHFYIRPCRP